MNRTSIFNSQFITFGIPILLILSLILLSQSTDLVTATQNLSFAIIFDLLLIVPFIYFLLIRKRNIPKTTVVPVFILSLVVGFIIIPDKHQLPLQLVKTWILPFVELGVLSYVSFKIYKTLQIFKQKRTRNSDFFTVVKSVCNDIVSKKAAILLGTEIAIFYYVFIAWKKYKLKPNEFSYYKNTGSIVLLIAVIGIIFIETYVFHILLAKWSLIAAYILSGLSIYTALQIFALLKSIPKRPFLIESDKLYLRYGILNETTINIKDIDSVEISTKEIMKNKRTVKLSPFADMEGHNIIIKLKNENILSGFYGLKKKYKTIVFYVDEKELFKNKLLSLLN